MNKYGFKLDEYSKDDRRFGAFSPMEPLVENGDWTPWLVQKEFQNLHNVEPYACVTFTILTCLEMVIKLKYGVEYNYADRFLAKMSETKVGGNSFRKVGDVLHKHGVPLEPMWPFTPNINTFEKFYADIPRSVIKLAEEFNRKWEWGYEEVPKNNKMITKALKSSPVAISVAAWHPKEGRFYRPAGFTDNHATTCFMEKDGEFRRVFDSYDAPHIKDYDWDSMPLVIKSFWIKKRTRKRWWGKLKGWV